MAVDDLFCRDLTQSPSLLVMALIIGCLCRISVIKICYVMYKM